MDETPGSVREEISQKSLAKEHGRLAGECWEAGNATEAVAEWEQALELAADLVEERVSLALAYFQIGRREEAFAQVRLALATQPEYERARHTLGQFFYQIGRFEDAIREYQLALTLRRDEALCIPTWVMRITVWKIMRRLSRHIGKLLENAEKMPMRTSGWVGAWRSCGGAKKPQLRSGRRLWQIRTGEKLPMRWGDA